MNISLKIHGTMDYDSALDLQLNERKLVQAGKSQGAILLLQHNPPVITLGRRSRRENILLPLPRLHDLGYQVRASSRGGDVTVHEPGQVLIYFICPVKSKNTHNFVITIMRRVKEFCNQTYGIFSHYDPLRPGLWADGFKFSSVGFDLTGGVSLHGVSVNVANSLKGFGFINPCGMSGSSVTSLERLCNRKIDANDFMLLFYSFMHSDSCFFSDIAS